MKTAMLHPNEFSKFRESILDQITKEGNVWFYFIEYDKPHHSSLIRIADIISCEIKEYQELTQKEKDSLVEKYKARASLSGLF